MERQVAICLVQLGALIDEVATKEEVVSGRDGERVAHEYGGIDDERAGHVARDSVCVEVGVSGDVGG